MELNEAPIQISCFAIRELADGNVIGNNVKFIIEGIPNGTGFGMF